MKNRCYRCKHCLPVYNVSFIFLKRSERVGYIFGSFIQNPTKLCQMVNLSYIYADKL